MRRLYTILTALLLAAAFPREAGAQDLVDIEVLEVRMSDYAPVESAQIDTTSLARLRTLQSTPARLSLYELPYSMTLSQPDWKHLWINAGIFAGAYMGTLAVLECLPEGATNWNRASIQNRPWYDRWKRNVIDKGPEWDGDDVIFNYLLHPYAGAVYFMSARSVGFNFYQSLLFSACVSTIGWEFGIEGTMERPSLQDIFITPLVGSVLGELFYHAKRYIVANDYHLLGSKFLGGLVCFIIDPVNEIVGLFGSETRRLHLRERGITSSITPTITAGTAGLAFQCTF